MDPRLLQKSGSVSEEWLHEEGLGEHHEAAMNLARGDDAPLPGITRRMLAQQYLTNQRQQYDGGGGGGGGGGVEAVDGITGEVLSRPGTSSPGGGGGSGLGSILQGMKGGGGGIGKIFIKPASQDSVMASRFATAATSKGVSVRSDGKERKAAAVVETTEERERRKMQAVYSSSVRNKDAALEKEGRVKRLLGGWRTGSLLEYFLAWRELTVSLRDIKEARNRVKPYLAVLTKRSSQRTDAELETLYGFVVEKDERQGPRLYIPLFPHFLMRSTGSRSRRGVPPV